jgi:hypothetical protein
MAQYLPPAPTGVPPGHAFWNDWMEKLRTLVNNTVNIAWVAITGTPTTLAGYGITDAAPLSHVGSGGATHANAVAAGAAGFMTGADKTKLDGAEIQSNKDAVSGYAGLNAVSRTTKGVDTVDDIVVDSITKGLVLKSPNGNYWRATISNLGVVTWTNLGATKP